MSLSFSRRFLLFSREFCHSPTVSAIEGVKSKVDSSEKADSKEEFMKQHKVFSLSPLLKKDEEFMKQLRELYVEKFLKLVEKPGCARKAPKDYMTMRGYSKKLLLEQEERYSRLQIQLVPIVETVFGYKFSDSELITEAFTHSSYLYHENPKQKDKFQVFVTLGERSVNTLMDMERWDKVGVFVPYIQANDIDKRLLASLVVEHDLHHYLRHKAPWLMNKALHIANFIPWQLADPLFCPPEVLPEIALSLLGAIYIDSKDVHVVGQAFRYFSVHRPEATIHKNMMMHAVHKVSREKMVTRGNPYCATT